MKQIKAVTAVKAGFNSYLFPKLYPIPNTMMTVIRLKHTFCNGDCRACNVRTKSSPTNFSKNGIFTSARKIEPNIVNGSEIRNASLIDCRTLLLLITFATGIKYFCNVLLILSNIFSLQYFYYFYNSDFACSSTFLPSSMP